MSMSRRNKEKPVDQLLLTTGKFVFLVVLAGLGTVAAIMYFSGSLSLFIGELFATIIMLVALLLVTAITVFIIWTITVPLRRLSDTLEDIIRQQIPLDDTEEAS